MASINDRWIRGIIAVVGAVAVMMLLDWLIPGGPVLSSMLNLSWEKIKYIGIALVVLVIALIAIVGHGISEAEDKWEFKRLFKTYRRLARTWLMNKLDNILAYTRIYSLAWHKERVLSDRLPELLKRNIVYLFSLNNYLKRYYIWLVKSSQVTIAERAFTKVWEWIKPYTYYFGDYDALLSDIHKCRSGGTIDVPDKDGNIIGTANVGLFLSIREFYEAVNEASELIAGVRGAYQKLPTTTPPTPLPEALLSLITTRINEIIQKLNDATKLVENSIDYLEGRAKAYGNFQIIKAWMYLVFDQDNPYGEQEHQYRLIPQGTWLVDQFGNRTQASHELEVNVYGEVLDDVNSNKNQFYDTLPLSKGHRIRRVAPQEILDNKIKPLSPPFEIMSLIGNDWQGGFRNMRFGRFRKYSKSYKNYVDAMATLGKSDFYVENNIPQPNAVVKDEEHAAFDRRAAVDTGVMKYAGRKNMHDTWPQVEFNPKEDPYPAVSSIGMSKYLIALAEKDTENMKMMNEYLGRFIQDIGQPVSSTRDAPETFKPLGGKEEVPH